MAPVSPPVTQTANFIYTYDDSLTGADVAAAKACANALASSCEGDLATLQSWFGFGPPHSSGYMFGANNRVTLNIFVDTTGNFLGRNGGFNIGGKCQILINPFTGSANGDQEARAVFVAEMSEIFMDFRNKQTPETTTWVPNNSMGEALSIVCTALMYPGGYYPNLGPRIWNWLNYRGLSRNRFRYSFERPNYIDENGPTDSDPITYGCGVVFIYYLLSQLNHSIQDIITKAGTTLGETYSNLEHRSDGWKRLHDLLALYYPEGAANYTPAIDNLFPVPQLASLTLSPATVTSGASSIATLTLNGPYAGGPITVTLLCDDPGWARVPPTLTIPAGSGASNFTVNTNYFGTPFKPAHVTIHASYGGMTVSAALTVRSPITAGIVHNLTLNPNRVTAGQSSQGTVTLEEAVPTDTLVGLAAVETAHGPLPLPGSGSSVASVPPSVIIPAGQTSAHFSIQTNEFFLPTVTRSATIMAGAVVTKYALLTIEHD